MTSADKNELQNKIKELETQKNYINSKFRRTINVIKKKKESEESEKFMKKYDSNGFDENGIHEDEDGFDRDGFNINGRDRDGRDRDGFDRDGFDRGGRDIYGKKKSSKIKTSKAKSFKDQKGKGYVNLPVALSKIYTNNSSKELINSIKQLIDDLYDTKKITKQVYNMLNKALTHVQYTTF